MIKTNGTMADAAGSVAPALPPGLQISRIRLHLPQPQRPLWASVLLLFLWALLLAVGTTLFSLWFGNRELIAWWHDGSLGKPYNRYMSIWLVLSQGTGGITALLQLLQLFYARNSRLTDAQAAFMRQKLLPLRRRMADVPKPDDKTKLERRQVGILTPDQLCDSILLFADDKDDAFDAWLQKAVPKRKAGLRADKDDPTRAYLLSFAEAPQKSKDGEPYWDYTGQEQPLEGEGADVFGVYPQYKASGFVDWRGCIQSWANGGLKFSGTRKSYWVWMRSGGQGAPGADMLVLKDLNGVNDESLWWDVAAQPDNVLARYGIPMQSPLVIAFVNQTAYFDKVYYDIDATAFSNLVGATRSGSSAGGWVGLLNGFSDSNSSDDFQNQIFKDVDSNRSLTPDGPCQKGLKIAAAVSTGLFATITASFFAYPKAEAVERALAAGESRLSIYKVFGGALIASLLGVGLSVFQAAQSC
jgi:hypothetical protein